MLNLLACPFAMRPVGRIILLLNARQFVQGGLGIELALGQRDLQQATDLGDRERGRVLAHLDSHAN